MPGASNVDTSELYARGMRRRKKMFGAADVEKRMTAAGEFGAPLQNIINAYVYGASGSDRASPTRSAAW